MHRFFSASVAVVSGLALTLTVTAATEVPASAASGCHATFKHYKTIKRGTSGTQAKAAQCLLNSAGYRVRADGSFSAADSAKLKSFQRTHDVHVTGNVYGSSWTALLSRGSKPTLRLGSRGAAVKRLQRSLTATGRYVPVTGYFGPITRSAVSSVQSARGWRATGVADVSVWRSLQAGDPIVQATKIVKKAVKASTAGTRGARALAFAKRHLGDAYRWGASGPHAWDCSGLTQAAWKAAGVSLPHNARQQFSRGRAVSRSSLRPGDLVFFYSGIQHVAIYAGGGKVIHAPRPGKRVSYIKISYMPYKGARRPG
jgi:cell wall-associated NlpC family hydrolase